MPKPSRPKPQTSLPPPETPPPNLSEVMAYLGARGGKAGKGPAKARSSDQASAAAKARWAKRQKPL